MKVIKVFLFVFLFLKADDYFISFSFIQINGKLIFTEFNCARAMVFKESKKKYLFTIPFKKNIKNSCNIYNEKIIDRVLKSEVFVYSNEQLSHSYLKSRTKLTFLPKRFDIIVKNGVLYFYLKE